MIRHHADDRISVKCHQQLAFRRGIFFRRVRQLFLQILEGQVPAQTPCVFFDQTFDLINVRFSISDFHYDSCFPVILISAPLLPVHAGYPPQYGTLSSRSWVLPLTTDKNQYSTGSSPDTTIPDGRIPSPLRWLPVF